MSVYFVDPLTDSRWLEFIETQQDATAFHSPEWLSALHRTYGYKPVVLTTSPPDARLTNGLAACEIAAWSGRRFVSLPFSDHCQPLVSQPYDRDDLFAFVDDGVRSGRWRSVEIRPAETSSGVTGNLTPTGSYWLHKVDLSQPLEAIYQRFHPSCVRRAIRRAERELTYEAGTSEALLTQFYYLLRLTRRRHGLVPQPIAWFRNLLACSGERVRLHIASLEGRPVAGMLTLKFGKTIIYKYGCSDAAFHRYGGMPLLFWRTIEEAKRAGCVTLDLGRSDADNAGLVAFKERLGGVASTITYYGSLAAPDTALGRHTRHATTWVFRRLPTPALTFAGRVLYKHFG